MWYMQTGHALNIELETGALSDYYCIGQRVGEGRPQVGSNNVLTLEWLLVGFRA